MKGAPEYPLVEVFESLQGEGRNSGRPCVFIRFAGCNLDCPWCDTPREARFSATLDELVAEAKSFRARSVVLTGGEPAVQEGMPELVAALKREGFWIAVETNGTKSPDWFAFVDYIACSPKAEYAALYDAPDALSAADEVRVVASGPGTAAFCRAVRARIAATDYYVSPCDRGGEIDYAAAKAALAELDGWSLSVQLHKLLGFR